MGQTVRFLYRLLVCLTIIPLAISAIFFSLHTHAQAITAPTQVNWPQWQFNAAHSGYNPYEKTLSPSNISQLTLDWEYTSKASFVSYPIAANGVVYFIEGQYLYGRDALLRLSL